jgi:2-succinyl-5-enolpyruvyl-6-hydroxy-3-cyclohexene-1-carboxylate synthase
VADRSTDLFEGGLLADVIGGLPDPATLVVSNSMPVRDLDRFGEPTTKSVTTVGNRGASGIDGVVSTALGAAHGTTDDVTLVIGDLAYYHDTTGLALLDRADVEATVVLINNDGGGIFHLLPIADFEPPFTRQFKTPHGIDFAPTADAFGFEFTRVDSREDFRAAYGTAVDRAGSHVIEVVVDAESSHAIREEIAAETVAEITD